MDIESQHTTFARLNSQYKSCHIHSDWSSIGARKCTTHEKCRNSAPWEPNTSKYIPTNCHTLGWFWGNTLARPLLSDSEQLLVLSGAPNTDSSEIRGIQVSSKYWNRGSRSGPHPDASTSPQSSTAPAQMRCIGRRGRAHTHLMNSNNRGFSVAKGARPSSHARSLTFCSNKKRRMIQGLVKQKKRIRQIHSI